MDSSCNNTAQVLEISTGYELGLRSYNIEALHYILSGENILNLLEEGPKLLVFLLGGDGLGGKKEPEYSGKEHCCEELPGILHAIPFMNYLSGDYSLSTSWTSSLEAQRALATLWASSCTSQGHSTRRISTKCDCFNIDYRGGIVKSALAKTIPVQTDI